MGENSKAGNIIRPSNTVYWQLAVVDNRTWYNASSTDEIMPRLTIVFDKVRPM